MISLEQLGALYPRARDGHLQAFAELCGSVFDEFGISGLPVRLHFFLAQIGHESGGLSIVEENMNYSAKRMTQVWPSRFPTIADAQPFAHNPEKLANKVYANRMGNGDPQSGDGFRFRGRGYIQITGRDGYREVGTRAGLDLIGSPELAFQPEHALRVACAFWKWKDLNTICDTGNFEKVTRRINGGTVGMDDRRAWLAKVRRILAVQPKGQSDPAVVRAVQLALRARGFNEVGAADGDLGPRTSAAISLFRERNGLSRGLIDDQLLNILGID